MDRFLGCLRDVNPHAVVIHASARTGVGLDEWCAWLLAVNTRRPS
jgi:Ni2+-binding GTPase involved in maturation of urease and hydrogenase